MAENGWGWQSGDDWETVYQTLSDADVLPSGLSTDRAWTNELLPEDSVVREYASQVSTDYDVDV